MSAFWCAAVLAAALAPLSATAEKRLAVLFTGDNGGEIAPCG